MSESPATQNSELRMTPVAHTVLVSLARHERYVTGRHSANRLAHIIHDGSSRNRAVASRDGHAEPRGPEAYLNSTSRE